MQIIFELFNTVFFEPIINLLVFIIRLLEASSIPGSLGVAIMLLTVIVRLIVWPFMASQLKSAKKMADLRPHLDELKEKHASDKQALAQAQMALYKEHGVNPAGGCLPAIIQIPIIIALYQSILALFDVNNGLSRINNALYFQDWHLNTTPDPNFLGLNLATKPSQFATVGFVVLLVPVLTAVLTFMQSKMMSPSPVKKYPSDSPKEKKEKESTEDAMVAMQTQMIYLMPLMVGYFAFSFPIGLAIYWNTFTLLGIWQQYKISGWGGMRDVVDSIKSRLGSNGQKLKRI